MRDRTMNWEYLISGIIGVGLLIYLTYALLKPEKF
jgi:K+-transporting ATPase KdpF subunit